MKLSIPAGAAVLLVLAAGAAAGIAARAASSDAETAVQAPAPAAVAAVQAGAEAAPAPAAAAPAAERAVPPGALERLRASASPDEWALIGDGVVTREEVAAAYAAADACTRAAAATIGGVELAPAPAFDPDGPVSFASGQSTSKEALDRAGEAHLACVARHFDDVLDAWDAARAEAVYRPTWDRLAACLAGRGYGTAPGMDLRQIVTAAGTGAQAQADLAACDAEARQGS